MPNVRQFGHAAAGSRCVPCRRGFNSVRPSWRSAPRPPRVGRLAHAAKEAASASSLRKLHPPLTARRSGRLQVSDLHTIAWEEYGNPDGTPVVVVHGGPGAGCHPNHARFFDPRFYRIILADQRGCGRSTPSGCLADNNTPALVADLEALRAHLRVDSWVLFGGSWGVALSIAYAQAHRQRVLGMILRGVCLMRPEEIQWVFGGGCAVLFPAAWARFLEGLSPQERSTPMEAYYARLTSADVSVRDSAAAHWRSLEFALGLSKVDALQVWTGSRWEQRAMSRSPPRGPPNPNLALPTPPASAPVAPYHEPPNPDLLGGPSHSACAQALLTCHYSVHSGFFGEAGLLGGIDAVRGIPAVAVHGRHDVVCPVKAAYDLHLAWPELELQVVPGAGHSMYDAGITHCLLDAADRMQLLSMQLN